MSEPRIDAFERQLRARRSARDRGASGERVAAAPGPAVGKRTLTEGVPAGYTEQDAAAFFERAIGEARAQLAALASADASLDRTMAAAALRRSLRTARDHLDHGPAPGLAARQARLAELEARADRALGGPRDAAAAPALALQRQTRTLTASPGAIAGPTTPIYVNRHAGEILAALGERVTRAGVPEPHARLRWKAPRQAAAALARAIRIHVEGARDQALKRLMQLSQPADLFALVDDLRRRPGARWWLPEIGVAIAAAFDEPIAASVQRMGVRVRARLDTQTGMPSVESLVASCPLDRVVGELLVDPSLVVVGARPGRGHLDDTPGHTFEHGPRYVTYAWQGARDPALWNWIRVTSPADATVEEVAQIPFLGGEVIDSEQAYRIAASPPYFGIPFETAKHVPQALVHAPYDLQRRLELGDPGPRYADRSALARSAISDDAALAQAPKPARHDPPIDRAIERAGLQLAFLHQRLAPWKVARPLVPASRFVERRRAELAGDRRKAERWAAAAAAQERVLHGTASELADVLATLEARGATPSGAAALGPAVRVLEAYAHAAGVSHLQAEAPAALDAARGLRALLPLAMAEDRIRLARQAVASQQAAQIEGNVVDPHARQTIASVPDLAARGADLRLAATRGRAIDAEAIEALAADADLTNLRAQIVALRTMLLAIEHRATAAGVPDARYRHGLPTLRAFPAALRKESDGWLAHLDDRRVTFGPGEGSEQKRRTERKRRAMGDVAQQLAAYKELAGIGRPDGYLAWAGQAIEDQRWRDQVAGVAVQVAILLATAQAASAGIAALRGVAIGAEVVSGIRAAGTIFQVAEVVTQAGLATGVQGMMGGDVGRRELAEHALASVLAGAAMRPFRGLLLQAGAVEQEVHGLARAALRGGRFAAELALEIGTGLAASAAARRVVHGGRFSIAADDEWIGEGISFVAGRFVHQRVQRLRERLRAARAERREASAAIDAVMRQAEALERQTAAARRPTPEDARSFLERYRQLLELERPLHPATLVGDHRWAANAADGGALVAEAAELSLHLARLSPVVAGEIYEGSPAQIRQAFATAKALGAALEPAHDAAAGVWRVRAGARTIAIRETGGPGVSEPQAARNRQEASRARAALKQRNEQLERLVMGVVEDGHLKVKIGHLVQGTGLAAAMDAYTLAGSPAGKDPPPLAGIPHTIGVGTGPDTFRKLADTPVGQKAPELDSAGWAMHPKELVSDHGSYTPATSVADAIAVTQYRSGVPILDARIVEVSVQPDASWKVSGAKVRVKVQTRRGELYLYADSTDLALGLGAHQDLSWEQINPNRTRATEYRDLLERSGRMTYGDEIGNQRGGRILVSGGSATAAWNSKLARELGKNAFVVDWIARSNERDPRMEAAKLEYQQNQKKLESGDLTASEAQSLVARQAELRAFGDAMLPRNLDSSAAAFRDPGIRRMIKQIKSLTPTEEIAGEVPGKVKVEFIDGSSGIYDQVVISHGADLAKAAEPGPAGALTLMHGTELRPVVVDGKVVALESIDPPGAVRVMGAAMWSSSWIGQIPENLRPIYVAALERQALAGPRDSPANPLVHHVGQQIPAANGLRTRKSP